MAKQCQFPKESNGDCSSVEYSQMYKDLEAKLKVAVEFIEKKDCWCKLTYPLVCKRCSILENIKAK